MTRKREPHEEEPVEVVPSPLQQEIAILSILDTHVSRRVSLAGMFLGVSRA